MTILSQSLKTAADSSLIAANKMKLLLNPKYKRGREALRCLMVLSLSGLEDVEIVTDKNIETPELVGDGTIYGSYAITRFLISRCQKHSLYITHSDPSTMWSIDSYVFWSLGHLGIYIDTVDKEAINRVLGKLEKDLSVSQNSDFLVGTTVTLADVFAWSSIATSHVFSCCEILKSYPNVERYVEAISRIPSAKFALQYVDDESSIRKTLNEQQLTKFYLTTAINYTNGPPHMGHAYEAVCSDVIARFHRIYGRDVFFLTGTDEHGQKISNTAETLGLTPIEICDRYAFQFKDLNALLNISNDFFIRTTSTAHKEVAVNVWKLSEANGDIYLDTYTGWYNVREETFVTEFEAEASDYKDPISGVPLQKMEESSYFFRMSKYQKQLIDHITANPDFIQPEFRRNEILQRLSEPLLDLSSSRTTFTWGIQIPTNISSGASSGADTASAVDDKPNDKQHIMYVWFDALTNYLSGIGYTLPSHPHSYYWPANVHIIGKDILWFHSVVWPCILMSCGIPLPKTVFAHGFVMAADGRKMSKSLGNVVDPVELLTEWPNSDAFRFYLVKGAEFGRDMRFDCESMIEVHNSDLADTLGNLVHRATGLCQKFCNGCIPDCGLPDGQPPPFDFQAVLAEVNSLINRFCLQQALEVIMQAVRETNKYLTEQAPWTLQEPLKKQKVCKAVAEALYILAHFLEPYIPIAGEKIFKRLGSPKNQLRSLSTWFDNLKPGAPVEVGEVLFVKQDAKSLCSSPQTASEPTTAKSP